MTQEKNLPDSLNPLTTTIAPAENGKPEGGQNEVHFINIDTGEVTTVVQGTVYPARAERRGQPSRLDPYIKNPALLIDALKDFEASKPGAKISDLTNAFRGIDWTSKRDLTGMASEADNTKLGFADGILDVLMYEPKQKLKTTAPINEVKAEFLRGILNDMYAETDPKKQGVKIPEDTYALLQLQESLLARALARNPYNTQGKREVAKIVSLFSGNEPCAKTNNFFFYAFYEALGIADKKDEPKMGKAKLVLDTALALKEAVSTSGQPDSKDGNIIDSITQKYLTIESVLRKSLEKDDVRTDRAKQDGAIMANEQRFRAQLPFGRMPKSLVERVNASLHNPAQKVRKALYAQLINVTAEQLDEQLLELIQLAQLARMTEADVRRIHSVIRPTQKLPNVWWNSVHLFSHPNDLSPIAHDSLIEVASANGHNEFFRISIDGDKRPTHVCMPAGEPETTAHALHLIDLAQKQGAPITHTPFNLHGDSIASQVVRGGKHDCHIFRIESEGVGNSTSPLRTLVEAAMEDQTLYSDEYVKIDGYGNRRYEVRRDFDNVYVNMQEWPDFAPVVYELGDDPTIGGLLVRGVIKPGDDGYEILMRPQHNLTVYPDNPPPDIVLKISINDIDNPTGDVLRFADEDVRKCLSEGQRDLLKYVGLRLFENSSQIPDAEKHSLHTSTDSAVARDEVDKPREPRIYKTHIGVRHKSGGLVAQGKPTPHAREQWMRYSTSGRRGRTLDAENEAQLRRHLAQGKKEEDFRYWTIAVGGEEHIDQAALDRLRKSKALTMLSGHYNKHLLRRNPKFA